MSDETKITTLEDQQGVKLPSLQGSLNQAAMTGQTLRVEGTNVVRVPFGVRRPRRARRRARIIGPPWCCRSRLAAPPRPRRRPPSRRSGRGASQSRL